MIVQSRIVESVEFSIQIASVNLTYDLLLTKYEQCGVVISAVMPFPDFHLLARLRHFMVCGGDTAASVNIYIMSGASAVGQLRTASDGTGSTGYWW